MIRQWASTPTMIGDTLARLDDAGLLYVGPKPYSQVRREARQLLGDNDEWVSTWALLGQVMGQEWTRCPECGEWRLIKPRSVKCSMTPGCTGKPERVYPRPRLTAAIKKAILS